MNYKQLQEDILLGKLINTTHRKYRGSKKDRVAKSSGKNYSKYVVFTRVDKKNNTITFEYDND